MLATPWPAVRDASLKLRMPVCEMSWVLETNTQTRHSIEDIGGRTRLTREIDARYRRLVSKLLAPVATRHVRTQIEADLDRLKTLVEKRR